MKHDCKSRISRVLKRARRPLRPSEIFGRMTNPHPLDAASRRKAYNALSYEASKPDGLFIRIDGQYELRKRAETRIGRRVRDELAFYGFEWSNGELKKPDLASKEDIRGLHASARAEKYERNKDFLEKNEDSLLRYFANGEEVSVEEFWPNIEVVDSGTWQSDLFRYATLLWSVPVSQGFGRRVRFLVWDEYTGKLVGLFALGDPVFNLKCRDNWIGWDHRERAERLYNVMDIFVLGAVPPFNILLGGKLVAMLACSNEVQSVIKKRYKETTTVIQEANKSPQLALLTTSSALGKSSLYERIRYEDRTLYQRIGESKGWGHFHLNHGLFEEMLTYLRATRGKGSGSNRFGDGPNWKLRTARSALDHLNLPQDILRHGIHRQVYAIPLARNFKSFLKGEARRLQRFDLPLDRLAEYWKARWFMPRAVRKPEYIHCNRLDVSKIIHSATQFTEGDVESVIRGG